MNRYNVKLAVLPLTGDVIHIVADFEIADNRVSVLTVCGRLFEPQMLIDVHHNQISCSRCASVSGKYNHKVGYIRRNDEDVDDIPF